MTTKDKAIYISNWIREYAENAGVDSLVVGCSGGIDSSVVSTLCAMTGLKVYAYHIGIESVSGNISLAEFHLKWLNLKFPNVETKSVYLDAAFAMFIHNNKFSPLAEANTKSRLRMAYLYAQANTHNGLVVGCGNKVEDFGIGFATVGGDLCVDISPIADLYKSEVYELAHELYILNDVINAEPNDGLWQGSPSDEEQIGCNYDQLESVMKGECTDQRIIAIYNKLHNKNKHKMIPIPVCKIPVQ